ncbi:hypothetical protein A2Z00_03925 [Candidatus Gottesmanbacteria bacterium RBG_13_45_10]|uniref:Glycosyltransferase RgtA/B/C/D-like domain-containing protein n=1 Tax=Candidatus Gottesmanbacteria bacterium RBG_13_45_10 TaxID=1798370 RepID=A0A1F5ZHE0_9BACT|nr:MAG: hypothetical protein A2Z00_03925 [Candidatus Gottesmanbacteria bacterium RBG_13_45_10]
MKKLVKLVPVELVIQLILWSILAVLLFWRWRVGMTRFFDVDEFTHLHWVAAMARGSRPYIDFFTFFTPGFYWFFMPLFWLLGASPSVFIASRVVALGIFFVILILTGVLFWILRSKRFSLLPVILLAFLPMPYDKFLEIRPDNLAVLFGLAGVVAQVWALVRSDDPKARLAWFISGFCYASSMVVLVKTLPFVVAALGVTILDSNLICVIWDRLMKGKPVKFVFLQEHKLFLLGLAIPSAVFGLWALTLGNVGQVIYSLTRMPLEANTVGHVLIMEPHLFFFGNPAFYGGWGITSALIANHALWTLGIFVGVHRFLTPYISGEGKKKRVLAEVLVATIFVLSVVGYVNYFPLKHSQYLIPIAIFIAFFAADGLVLAMRPLERRFGKIAIALLLLVGAYVINQQTVLVNSGKLLLSNTKQMAEAQELKAIIPPNDEVFDIEGRMIFWKDPYYICCLPIGIFVNYLSRPPQRLYQVLVDRKVPYIFQGLTNRLSELAPEEQWVLRTYYEPVVGWRDQLWRRK